MKHLNIKSLASVAIASVLLSSCASLQKMKKNADQISFKVTPEVLETHAGDVDVAINGVFPSKYFRNNFV